MTATTTPSNSSSLKNDCEEGAVGAQLLYNSTEKTASRLLLSAERYVKAGQALLVLAVASAGVVGLLASWQYRRIHRVWRIRHPRRLAQQRQAMWAFGTFGTATFLLLLSPIGPGGLHEARLEDVKRLDDIAVRALILKRRYESAAALAATLRENETTGWWWRTTAQQETEAREMFERCEDEWRALMKERIAIDPNV
ncbi:uncharacterized protein TEOVI_000574400 [Trypanosoma equiperdum]|uniref:Transmembrane protein n=2 Tax=Trypanozoon TaxID=39700 RepID=Q585G3_TRYB2|nr:hypothetical protein, conserved [Trypanosoma brucei brucei TREU927]AAX80339.1 hypothetical protein, conserved [Trypanosoma brucei]AAZ11647.1 hypothetical protein, conserved [Trypanosoma brucei brucei TREU927]SCU67890.1 hypothetical protein, conserved [Trypanosoma equiperdum]